MSAEIVNLRRARKERARAEKELKAAENRRRHGRSRAERLRDEREAERQRRTIEAARIESSDGVGECRPKNAAHKGPRGSARTEKSRDEE